MASQTKVNIADETLLKFAAMNVQNCIGKGLTDADVGDTTTIATLVAALEARKVSAIVRIEDRLYFDNAKEHAQRVNEQGLLSDAEITAFTTAAGLRDHYAGLVKSYTLDATRIDKVEDWTNARVRA